MKNSLSHQSFRNLLFIFFILLFIIGIAVSLVVVNQRQIFKPKASESYVTVTCEKPAAPQSIVGTQNNPGEQILAWDAVPGATAYAIRVDNPDNDWNGLCDGQGENPGDACGNIATTTYRYNFQAGKTYHWWVHAINSCGGMSDASNYTMTIVGDAPPAVVNNPIGSLDAPGPDGQGGISGWAADRDEPNTAIDVHLYFNGPAGSGTGLNIGSANAAGEQAICSAIGSGATNCNHRFSVAIPAQYCDDANHIVYAYGINVGGGGNAEIGSKTFKCTAAPPAATCAKKAQGDADCNDVIDSADYAIWRSEFLAGTVDKADFNADGRVSLADFEIWRKSKE